MPQKSIRILIVATLPGRVRVTEILIKAQQELDTARSTLEGINRQIEEANK